MNPILPLINAVTRTVLIDGPSGSGKTTLASDLAAGTGFTLVHLDDFYPGWSGLTAAREMVAREVLRAARPGFVRWDWQHDVPGEWHALDPADPLIVEGVGAISHASIVAAQARGGVVTVCVDAPAEVRQRSALTRDPGYAGFWDLWAAQEAAHFAEFPPVDLRLFHT